MLGRADWLQAAIDNGEFLLRELRRPTAAGTAAGRPTACRRRATTRSPPTTPRSSTRSRGSAEASGQARWIDAARETADTMLDHFWDVDHGGVFTTADDGEQLVARQKDILDNATPSANSTAADRPASGSPPSPASMRYANHADRIFQLLGTVVAQAPGAVSNALLGIETRSRGITEVAIVGDRPDLVRLAQSLFRPDVVLAWGERYDSPLWHERTDGLAYVCRDYACEAPQDTPEGFFRQLTGHELPAGWRPPTAQVDDLARSAAGRVRRCDRAIRPPGRRTDGRARSRPTARGRAGCRAVGGAGARP